MFFKSKPLPPIQDDAEIFIDEHTAFKDGLAIFLAMIIVALLAVFIGKMFQMDADILFGVFATTGSHPIAYVLRKVFYAVA